MMEWLHALGGVCAAVAGIFSTWAGLKALRIKARDRREQREALVKAQGNKDLADKLQSLPPLAGVILLLLGGALGMSSAVMIRTSVVLASDAGKRKCNKQNCPPPGECVSDECRGAAEEVPSECRPHKPDTKQAEAPAHPVSPSSWLEVRSAWADQVPEGIDPLERPDAD